MDNNEQLIRLQVILEGLVDKVEILSQKVETSYNWVIKEDSRLAVAEEKISRLEWIVYGSVGFIILELITIVTMLVRKT